MTYLARALAILIEFAFSAAVALFVLRLLAEAVRADFYNPICQFLYRTTNPVLTPLKRVIPNWRRISLAALLIAWLLEIIKNVLLYTLLGLWTSVTDALLSWVSVDARHPLVPLLGKLVDPVLRPLRRLLPAPGGLDLSPLVAIVVILVLRVLVVAPLLDLGHRIAL